MVGEQREGMKREEVHSQFEKTFRDFHDLEIKTVSLHGQVTDMSLAQSLLARTIQSILLRGDEVELKLTSVGGKQASALHGVGMGDHL
jgi:hypothetical protein